MSECLLPLHFHFDLLHAGDFGWHHFECESPRPHRQGGPSLEREGGGREAAGDFLRAEVDSRSEPMRPKDASGAGFEGFFC